MTILKNSLIARAKMALPPRYHRPGEIQFTAQAVLHFWPKLCLRKAGFRSGGKTTASPARSPPRYILFTGNSYFTLSFHITFSPHNFTSLHYYLTHSIHSTHFHILFNTFPFTSFQIFPLLPHFFLIFSLKLKFVIN